MEKTDCVYHGPHSDANKCDICDTKGCADCMDKYCKIVSRSLGEGRTAMTLVLLCEKCDIEPYLRKYPKLEISKIVQQARTERISVN